MLALVMEFQETLKNSCLCAFSYLSTINVNYILIKKRVKIGAVEDFTANSDSFSIETLSTRTRGL